MIEKDFIEDMEKAKKATITIKDIAAEANVSLSTVSRVINNSAGVAEDKRRRVIEAIERHNYRPNLLARGLKSDSTQTIAMLISDGNNEYFGQLTKAIENVIRPHSYNLFYCNTLSEQDTEESYLQLMTERQVDGFIINTTGHNNEYIASLSQKIPTVLLHRRIPCPDFRGDFLDADFGSVSYELCQHLIRNGHRDIGLICGPSYLSSHLERLVNIQRALKMIDVEMGHNHPYYFEGPLTEEFGYQSCHALLSMPNPPTALVISHSSTTIGALRYFKEKGVHIPQDISFVSPCDVQLADILYVEPTCAQPDAWALGERCGQMMMERILSGNRMVNREAIYAPTISYGNSVLDLNTNHLERKGHCL